MWQKIQGQFEKCLNYSIVQHQNHFLHLQNMDRSIFQMRASLKKCGGQSNLGFPTHFLLMKKFGVAGVDFYSKSAAQRIKFTPELQKVGVDDPWGSLPTL